VLLFWSRLNMFQGVFVMLYGIVVHALWFAPIYSWLLLVSAWARRAAIVWAFLPLAALLALERIVFSTKYVPSFIKYRLGGAMIEAFTVNAAKAPIDGISHLAPVKFLTTPGLWFGLLFAAACLVSAVRLRRNREAG
jgi:ABC-2 type transport system permease protein